MTSMSSHKHLIMFNVCVCVCQADEEPIVEEPGTEEPVVEVSPDVDILAVCDHRPSHKQEASVSIKHSIRIPL